MNHYIKQSVKVLSFSLLSVIAINIVSDFFYKRFDLTEEKRYTLTPSTKDLLNKLDQHIDIEVYLEGTDLPAGIKILRNETRELLQEFRTNSHGNVSFHFFDINEIRDQKKREDFQTELVKKGLQPTNLEIKSQSGYSEKLVFPGAVIKANGREVPIQILENQFTVGAQGSLNNSINFLEYKVANGIANITRNHPPKIAFLQGHGEPGIEQLQEFLKALSSQNFILDKIELDKDKLLNNNVDVLIIDKPQTALNDYEKFLVDQYIMSGGKTIWMLDNVVSELDSFKLAPSIFAIPRDLNLDDLLFRYGVRMEHNLVLDLYCSQIPIIESVGGNPQPKLFPWVFFPVSINKKNHPIVNNLDPVAFKFCSSIDTLNAPGIKKTVLLSSSEFARVQETPYQIFLEGAKQKPNPYLFNQKNIPLAVLLEGNFTSLYKNQFTSDLQKLLAIQNVSFQSTSKKNKMIVIGDGDLASNGLDANGVPLALGYDKYTRQMFANKDFLLNCVEYLIDEHNLIDARNRDIKMRLLDKAKILNQKELWQVLNFALPLLLVLLSGIIYNRRRRAKYAR